jgi:two-component system, OmpR family, response regulator
MQPIRESRIVIVDDETDLCSTVAEYLGAYHYDVRTASSGASLDACLATEAADLVLLNVNMAGEDGFSIARRLRAASSVPIIMLTAMNRVEDRVFALEIGADDYIAKPFNLRELLARVRTVISRAKPGSTKGAAEGSLHAPEPPNARIISFGRVKLDLEKHCLIDESGACEELTAMEFDLLSAFARHPNRVLSRDRLLYLAHSRDIEPLGRSIDIRVTRLRKKIEADSARPQVIKTVRGEGYMFIPPKEMERV